MNFLLTPREALLRDAARTHPNTNETHTMPRKPDALVAQIKALDALVKADRAEQREAEAPISRDRRSLSEALRRGVRAVDRANQRLANLIYDAAFKKHEPWPFLMKPAEDALAQATAMFKERLVALETFDVLHGIEGAEYPQLPMLDREATKAAARVDFERDLADIRARGSARAGHGSLRVAAANVRTAATASACAGSRCAQASLCRPAQSTRDRSQTRPRSSTALSRTCSGAASGTPCVASRSLRCFSRRCSTAPLQPTHMTVLTT